MKLSKNFTLNEYTKSQTATRLGIDNQPGYEHLDKATKLFDIGFVKKYNKKGANML